MNNQRLPVATVCIIAANITAAFVLIWNPQLVGSLGFLPDNPSAIAAFTCLFLHQNVLHLLGNMVFLAAVGPAVENAAGSVRFLLVYVIGGLTGVLVHWFFMRIVPNPAPLIGASGSISACIAYYALRFYHTKVNVAPKFQVPVYWMVALWLVLQATGAFVNIGSSAGGTAYWAHLGGFAMGLLLSLSFGASEHASRDVSYKSIDEMDTRSPAAKLAAADLALKGHPDDINALQERANALSMLNESDEEAVCLIRLLDLLSEQDQKEILLRLHKINRLEKVASLKRTLLAEKYKMSEPDLSRLLLLSVIRVMSDRQRPEALFALACLDHEAYPDNARTWLKDLFTNYPMHPAADLARTRGWAP